MTDTFFDLPEPQQRRIIERAAEEARQMQRATMAKYDRTRWLEHLYPLTVIADRYSGAYSGGAYVAFPLEFDAIPAAVHGGDVACAGFWWEENIGEDAIPCGLGESVEAAFQDLKRKMAETD